MAGLAEQLGQLAVADGGIGIEEEVDLNVFNGTLEELLGMTLR